jgi:hypothetical protein
MQTGRLYSVKGGGEDEAFERRACDKNESGEVERAISGVFRQRTQEIKKGSG